MYSKNNCLKFLCFELDNEFDQIKIRFSLCIFKKKINKKVEQKLKGACANIYSASESRITPSRTQDTKTILYIFSHKETIWLISSANLINVTYAIRCVDTSDVNGQRKRTRNSYTIPSGSFAEKKCLQNALIASWPKSSSIYE